MRPTLPGPAHISLCASPARWRHTVVVLYTAASGLTTGPAVSTAFPPLCRHMHLSALSGLPKLPSALPLWLVLQEADFAQRRLEALTAYFKALLQLPGASGYVLR